MRISFPTVFGNLAAALLLLAVLGENPAAAADPVPAEDTALGTIGEIFLKGSIDGKHMFLVLGMKKAVAATKDIAEWAIHKDGLQADGHELAEDFREVGEDATEFDDAFRNGVRFTQKGGEVLHGNAPEIWRAPWRSLRKIPGAYRVNFDRARDAYYGSKHASVGALKYAGWAAWANIEGAYYLVIEAPAKVVGEVLFTTLVATGTALGVPGALAFKGIELAWDATEAALHSAWVGTKIVLRATAGLIATIATVTYSLVSTGTAELLAGVAYVGVMTYRAGKLLLVELPRKARFPIAVERPTSLGYEQQTTVAALVAAALRSLSLPEVSRLLCTERIGKYRSSFNCGDAIGRIQNVALTLKVERQRVVLKLELTRDYVRLLRKSPEFSDLRRTKAKHSLKARFQAILDSLPIEEAGNQFAEAS